MEFENCWENGKEAEDGIFGPILNVLSNLVENKRTILAINQHSKLTIDELVVSLGGGAPIFPQNQELISDSGKTVYLSGSLEVLWSRIAGDEKSDTQRPAPTDLEGRAEVEHVLAQRAPIYAACADYTIDVDDLSPQEIADAIDKWFRDNEKDL